MSGFNVNRLKTDDNRILPVINKSSRRVRRDGGENFTC